MPDIENRTSIEQSVKNAVARAFRKAAASNNLDKALHANIIAEVQPITEDTQKRALIALLLMLANEDDTAEMRSQFLDATGPDFDRAMKLAGIEAKRQAKTLADGIVRTNRDRRKQMPDDVASVRKWERDNLLSEERADTIAVTETTTAISRGEHVVAQIFASKGKELSRIWRTEKDERVCKICGRYDGQTDNIWGVVFPDGPPAHVNCRCTLDWE